MRLELKLRILESPLEVSAILQRPDTARWLLVLSHGAGAGMRHAFMESLAQELAAAGIASFRFNFPYMEPGGSAPALSHEGGTARRGRRGPDSPALLQASICAAIQAASEAAPDLPLLAGGKSLGGRMSSHVFSEPGHLDRFDSVGRVRGLVFFGFPLHPPGQPGTRRGDHLPDVPVPMLFLQGTRDALADLELLRPLCARLARRATLHVVEGADHSFHVLKRSGTDDAAVLRGLALTMASWADSLLT